METQGTYGPILLATHPAARGFLSRYLLGLTPVVLAALSLVILAQLKQTVTTFPPALVTSLETLVPEIPAFIEMSVLLVAPIGIFLLFIYIGDATNHAEIWTGAALALLLSGIGAFYQVSGLGIPTISTAYLLALCQWIAFLIQPASVIAAVIVILGTELYRRSIRYTLYRDIIRITGGIWTKAEHLVSYRQIHRIILKQGRFSRMIHTGTIMFAGSGYRGPDPVRNGSAGMNGNGNGYSLVSPDGDSTPLNSLYGIRDPETAKEILEKKIREQ